jgi:hypothetical protein
MPARSVARTAAAVVAVGIAAAASVPVAIAAVDESYFAGKTITIHASGAGSTSDIMSRLIQVHMPQYIPGRPKFRVQNWATGMGVPVWRAVFTAKPDGLTWGHQQLQEWISDYYLGGNPPQGFEPEKIKRIGSPNLGLTIRVTCVHEEIAKSWDEVLKKRITLTHGSTRPGDSSGLGGAFIELLGGPIKSIYGYQSNEVNTAFDRKEINITNRCRAHQANPAWFDPKVPPNPVPLFKAGRGEEPAFYQKLGYPEPPDILDLPGIKYTPGQAAALKVAMELSAVWRWTVFLHPDASKDIQAILIKAYFELSKNPDYIKGAVAAGVDVEPPTDEEAMGSLKFVTEMAADAEAVQFYKKLIGATN